MSSVLDVSVPGSPGAVLMLSRGLTTNRPSIWEDPRFQTPAIRPTVPPRQVGLFAVLWVAIGLVSAYDTYLTVRFQESLNVMECNPIALWLLAYDEWSAATLVGLKFLGSMVVLGALCLCFWFRPHWGLVVTLSIALLQGSLLAFLTLG
ncbi:MAG: hypothetical protein ACK50P_13205 [Planctomycetaceae bacterium]|jgi:hypothetical protein